MRVPTLLGENELLRNPTVVNNLVHPTDGFRVETDMLGSRQVPAAAYYGIHTLRANENLRISGTRISTYRNLLLALASVKQAAAEAKAELGLLPVELKDASVDACLEIRNGQLRGEFVVDVVQGGAGTSTKHECERGNLQSCIGATGPRERRLRIPSSIRAR
jgi:hypothetical protein